MPRREELVVAAGQGDTDAFAALIEMDGPAALRLARAIVRQPADAEDALQEAFLRAWRDLPDLRDAARWPAWFRRIVVRCSLDAAGRRGRIREITLERPTVDPPGDDPRSPAYAGADHGLADPSAWGSDPAVGAVTRDLVSQALARLGPEDRALLALRYLADLEVPDTAAALGLRLGTAKSRLHRLLARLRQELEAES